MMLEAGHGRVSDGWRVSTSLQPWRQGLTLNEVFERNTPQPPSGLAASTGAATIEQVLGGAGGDGGVRVGNLLFDAYEALGQGMSGAKGAATPP